MAANRRDDLKLRLLRPFPTRINRVNRTGEANQANNCTRSSPSVCRGSGYKGYENKIFVGDLNWETTVEKFRDYFSMFGTITEAIILKELPTSYAFGFIKFVDQGSISRVLAVPIHVLDGRTVCTRHARPPPRSNKDRNWNSKKAFIGGVSDEMSEEEVKAYFSQFGKVEECEFVMDHKRDKPQCYGFVAFEKGDTMNKVCEIRFHTINGKNVECRRSNSFHSLMASKWVLPKAETSSFFAQGFNSSTWGVFGMNQSVPFPAMSAASYYAGQSIHYNSMLSYRHMPYPMPNLNAANFNGFLNLLTDPPYGVHALPEVHVSSLQNINWPGFF